MMHTKQLEIQICLYGPLREYMENNVAIVLSVPAGIVINELRPLLIKEIALNNPDFSEQSIVDVSAFANENELLNDNYVLQESCQLSIFPPVCGG